MTQKELLYVEDAISHEEAIISYLNYAKENLSDSTLVTFIVSEIEKHEDLLKKLFKTLKENIND